MLAPYGALITKVIHFKETYRHYAGVDACAANLMRPAIYDAYHHITVLGKEEEKETKTYDVVGSLCENNDKFAKNRELPVLEKGDYLFFHDAGAHGFASGIQLQRKALVCRASLERRRYSKVYQKSPEGYGLFCHPGY